MAVPDPSDTAAVTFCLLLKRSSPLSSSRTISMGVFSNWKPDPNRNNCSLFSVTHFKQSKRSTKRRPHAQLAVFDILRCKHNPIKHVLFIASTSVRCLSKPTEPPSRKHLDSTMTPSTTHNSKPMESTRTQQPEESVTAPIEGQKQIEQPTWRNRMKTMDRLVEERQQKYMRILGSCDRYEESVHGLDWSKPVRKGDGNMAGRARTDEQGG